MADAHYELSAAQAAFLDAARRPARRGRSPYPQSARFSGALPEVLDQSVRSTCVASAVAALVACSEGCRRRVSVQYLAEVTRLVERAWIARNMGHLLAGEPTDGDFAAAFPDAVAQAALLVRANGVRSEAASAFVNALGAKIRAHIESDAGCRLKRCFEALEEYGVCRAELWPYSPVALDLGAAGGDAVGSFPPGTHEDARRHRIVSGLYVLRAPNNVDEIRGLLAGAQGRRPMPVSVGLELFEGRTDGGVFALPEVVRREGRATVAERPLGIHEVLLVAYEDDAKWPGGGFFTFQNSWGPNWGDGGAGRVSYAYVACFCREAGTILQERDDYDPAAGSAEGARIVARRRLTLICAVGICLAAMLVSIAIALWSWRAARPPAAPAPARAAGPMEDVPPGAGEEDPFAAAKIVDYKYVLRGTCGSAAEAREMARILGGTHREVTFGEIKVDEATCSFEGEATIEGLAGRPPHAIQAVEEYLKRKKLASLVRKWSVRRLR